jgi:tRNA(Ile)-lysidine synthase TilS/MesJ
MCKNCGKNSVYELTNKRKFCKNCFCRYFEKKVLHTIRKYRLVDNTKRVFVICKSIKGKIILNILNKIAKKRGIEVIQSKRYLKAKKYDKIALEHSIDDEAFSIIFAMMGKNLRLDFIGPEIKKGNRIFIKPLYFCLDKEIELYAKINRIRGKTELKEKNALKLKISDFIDFMEKKHPEIKNAIVNAMLEILPSLKRFI